MSLLKEKKIIVLGSPGSGKSYFSGKLSGLINYPVFYLDKLYWKENWVGISNEELSFKLEKIMAENKCWIIDGNYSSTLEMRYEKAELIFYFDLPVEICLRSHRERLGKKRIDLPDYLEEKEDAEFEQYIKDFPQNEKPKFINMQQKYPEKKVIIFKQRSEANKFLEKLNSK